MHAIESTQSRTKADSRDKFGFWVLVGRLIDWPKHSCANTVQSLSLSLSLSLSTFTTCNQSLQTDRPTCLIRGKQAYQELLSSPTLRPMITTRWKEHFRQVPSFRCMPCADPEGGQGVRTPLKNHKIIGFPSNIDRDPLKSQSYQASVQWWTIIDTPAKRHFNGVSLMGRWWPILVAFRSPLTTHSDNMFWIRACMQCVWTGSIEIKLSTDIMSWYFGTSIQYATKTQTSLRKCAFSIQHWWLRYVKHLAAFMLNGLTLCLTTQTTTWKKALLYISLYKQTYLANLLSCCVS